MRRGSDEESAILALHDEVITALGLVDGPSHTEFIRSTSDGLFYFLETASRPGASFIPDLVEASTGINLWKEWAKYESGRGAAAYTITPTHHEYAGVLAALTHGRPIDMSRYEEPEIVWRSSRSGGPMPYLAIIVRSPSHERVEELMRLYDDRLHADFRHVT